MLAPIDIRCPTCSAEERVACRKPNDQGTLVPTHKDRVALAAQGGPVPWPNGMGGRSGAPQASPPNAR